MPQLWARLVTPQSPGAAERDLALLLARLCTSADRNRPPTAAGLPSWPRYTLKHPSTVVLDAHGARVLDEPSGQLLRLWGLAAPD
jgi:hypothetical protein